jgi:hypothetical protein
MSRSVAAGSSITLYAEFYDVDTDGNRSLVDPDTTPVVSIYDAFHDPRSSGTVSGDALIYQAASTQVTTGIYRYVYTVSSNQITNWWFDVWEATLDGETLTGVMQFLVTGDDEGTTPLSENFVVQITLDGSIGDTSGNTLEEDYEFWFLTTMNPMYSDPVRLRTYAGSWLSAIPDETLMLMLYESSVLADDITPDAMSKNNPVYNNARTRFVTADAAMRLLSLPVNQGGMTKMLGDMLVKREGAAFIDMIDRIKKDRDTWEQVVNACGWIGPGESWEPISVSKGQYDPDRRNIGRRWTVPGNSTVPIVNAKQRPNGRNLYEFTHKSVPGSGSSTDEDLD